MTLRSISRVGGTQALVARVLVDSTGPTSYLFEAASATMDVCAIAWLPLVAHAQPTITFGAPWYVLSAAGNQISSRPTATTGSVSSGHGHGH